MTTTARKHMFGLLCLLSLMHGLNPTATRACPSYDATEVASTYQRGWEAYQRNDFQTASHVLEPLFLKLQCGHDKYLPAVAWALGQCARFRSDFAGAFYFYARAVSEYANYSSAEATEWRGEAENYLLDMANHLAPVTLVLAPREANVRVCDVSVDDAALAEIERDSIAALLDARGAASMASLVREGAFIGGVQPSAAKADCRWSDRSPDRATILMSGERVHQIVVDRREGTQQRSALVSVAPTSQRVIELADERASVMLVPASETTNPASHKVTAKVTSTLDAQVAFPLLWMQPVLVAAGSYRREVELAGFEVRSVVGPEHFLPGEHVLLKVDAVPEPESTEWYRSPWFWTGVGIVVVAVAATGAIAATAGSHKREIDRGSLDWLVEVK